MTGPDLLESGSARSPSRTGRRRLVGIAVVLVLALTGIVLAARSGGHPDTAAAPPPRAGAPAAPPVVRAPDYYLYDTAVANGRVYALAGFCVGRCGYRLLSWDGTGWSSVRMSVPASSVSPGRLLVTGHYLTVLDGTRPGAYVSTDGGHTFRSLPGRTGSPVAAVPTGLTADLGEDGVGVFDPVSGQRHRLRAQPMAEVRSVTSSGGTIYATARQGTALVVATSRDAGRSWRRTTVLRVPYRTPELALVPGAGGSAYLVVTRTLPAGEPGVIQVWHSGPTWTRLVDYSDSISSTPKFSTAVADPAGGILLADGTAGGQLIYDTGRSVNFYLPRGRAGDPPLVPTVLRRGGDTTSAITADGGHLLLRRDHDVGWTVMALPG